MIENVGETGFMPVSPIFLGTLNGYANAMLFFIGMVFGQRLIPSPRLFQIPKPA